MFSTDGIVGTVPDSGGGSSGSRQQAAGSAGTDCWHADNFHI